MNIVKVYDDMGHTNSSDTDGIYLIANESNKELQWSCSKCTLSNTISIKNSATAKCEMYGQEF